MKMQKEIKVCDICETELHENKFLSEDGNFFQSYFSQENIDLCPSCLCNLMMQFKVEIPNLKEKVEKLKDKNYNITYL
jgi:hypothetical protein